jgi:hypothetical protein
VRAQSVLSAFVDLLVEPVDEALAGEPRRRWTEVARPVIAVAGLAPRCGTTTVARALGAVLALRDPDGAAIVTSEVAAPGGGVLLGTAAATRLARVVERSLVARTRAVGRLSLTECAIADSAQLTELTRDLAPLVIDVADPGQASLAASLADAVVLVGAPDVEPALAAVLSDSLRRVGPEPIAVLNRDRASAYGPDRDAEDATTPGSDRSSDEGRRDSDRWGDGCALRLPESRVGARLALAGREPPGRLGHAVATLADLVIAP